jgi:hypothetical protein
MSALAQTYARTPDPQIRQSAGSGQELARPCSTRVRASLSTYFAWLVGEGMLDANPVSGTNRAAEIQPIHELAERVRGEGRS